jgi:preprotein translocase subunit SecE
MRRRTRRTVAIVIAAVVVLGLVFLLLAPLYAR